VGLLLPETANNPHHANHNANGFSLNRVGIQKKKTHRTAYEEKKMIVVFAVPLTWVFLARVLLPYLRLEE